MRKVLKSIARAVGKALKAVFKGSAVAGLACLHGVSRLLFGHQAAEDLPEPQMPEGPLDLSEIEDDFERDEVRKGRLVHSVLPYAPAFEWLCTPPERRQYVDIKGLTLPACVWMRSLSDAEAQRVRAAGLQAMCDHICGARSIPKVRAPKLPLKDFSDFVKFDDEMPILERSAKLIASAEEGRKAARMAMR